MTQTGSAPFGVRDGFEIRGETQGCKPLSERFKKVRVSLPRPFHVPRPHFGHGQAAMSGIECRIVPEPLDRSHPRGDSRGVGTALLDGVHRSGMVKTKPASPTVSGNAPPVAGHEYTDRLFRQGKASISADLAGIFERLGCSAENWHNRMQRLSGDRLLGRFFRPPARSCAKSANASVSDTWSTWRVAPPDDTMLTYGSHRTVAGPLMSAEV
jgi:hypothetical protein